MKKRLLVSLLLCAALLLILPVTARAEAKLDYVNDYAGILSASERERLNARAAEVSRQYGCGVYIVTVDSYTNYVRGGIEEFTEAIYKSYELGEGEGRNGILLALSMNDRDFDLCAYGDFGNYAFTDYGKRDLYNRFVDNFRNDDWAGGLSDYIEGCAELLARAKSGEPVDTFGVRGYTMFEVLVIVLVPGFTAGSVVGGFKRQMKTAVRQTGAGSYIGHGGVRLRERTDQFINRSVVRQPIPRATTNRPQGGQGGGTTVNSGGFSHSSGKF